MMYLKNIYEFTLKKHPSIVLIPCISILAILSELTALFILYPFMDGVTALSEKGGVVKYILHVFPQITILGIINLVFLFVVARIVFHLLSNNLAIRYGKNVLYTLATTSFRKVLTNIPLNKISEKSIGHYIALSGDESFRISNLVIDISHAVTALILSIAYLVSILYLSANLSAFVITFSFFSSGLILIGLKRLRRLGEMQLREAKAAASIFLDALNSIRTVRSYHAEDYVCQSYSTKMKRYTNILYKIDFFPVFLKMLPLVLLSLATLVFLNSGKGQANFQTAQIPFYISYVFCLLRLFTSSGQLLNMIMRVYSESKVGEDITQVLNYPNQNRNRDMILEDNVKTYTLKNISMSYIPGKEVLKDLMLTLHSNEMIAIYGPSGSGKSTLLDIMVMLIKPNKGQVLINGIDAEKLTNYTIRRKIQLVEQEVTIFNDSIYNNIDLGEGFSLEKIRKACQLALIDDFIMELDSQYETLLNYKGANLSGGQRQRINIARALVRDPDILLFDEVTSALDVPTCLSIIQNIKASARNKIIVFVTHDPRLMEYVDKAYMLQEGALVPIHDSIQFTQFEMISINR